MGDSRTERRALLYSCSGCSSVAQLANHLAVRLDREGYSETSCIAGIGGDVPSLVRKLERATQAGRAVVAIDGCVLACARHSLLRHGVEPTRHLRLDRLGIRKVYGADFDPQDVEKSYAELRRLLEELE